MIEAAVRNQATTPAELSPALRELCRHLVSDGAPSYVAHEPILPAPEKECFKIVDDLVARQGGQTIFGWALWERPQLFVEAEFHAIWKMSDGSLTDPTPRPRPFRSILFLPDPHRIYEGRQVNNVRRALRKHPAVESFIDAWDAQFELLNRGERAFQNEVSLTPEENAQLREIMQRALSSEMAMMALHPFYGPYDPCWCGSGKKVKWCNDHEGV
jgi:hypothetical protein